MTKPNDIAYANLTDPEESVSKSHFFSHYPHLYQLAFPIYQDAKATAKVVTQFLGQMLQHSSPTTIWREPIKLYQALYAFIQENSVGNPLNQMQEASFRLGSRVMEKVMLLPEEQRVAIQMICYQKYSLGRAAQLLQVPEPMLKSQLRSAFRQLFNNLQTELPQVKQWHIFRFIMKD